MTTRNVRDTFLHFLADNLPGYKIHPIRTDPNDPSAGLVQADAINVQFLNFDADLLGKQSVVIDICNSDENTCDAMVWAVWTLLNQSFLTQLYDYTDPTNPTALDGNALWDRGKVRFKRVYDDNYCRYSCELALRFFAY